jgi:hypothetical protein
MRSLDAAVHSSSMIVVLSRIQGVVCVYASAEALTEQPPPPPPAVESDAFHKWRVHFSWAHRAMDAVGQMAEQNPQLRKSVFWTGNLRCASSYSGVCAELHALTMLQAAAKQAPCHPGFTFQCVSACEKDKDCQETIRKLHAGDSEMHIYSDLIDILPQKLRAAVLEAEASHVFPWEETHGALTVSML